jgi:hypothetical protein
MTFVPLSEPARAPKGAGFALLTHTSNRGLEAAAAWSCAPGKGRHSQHHDKYLAVQQEIH